MYYTTATATDGFGAQYQRIVETYIYCKMNNLNFLYKPFDNVEHNYKNDINYVNKLEELINLKNNIENINNQNNICHLDYNSRVRSFFEINIDEWCNTEHMEFIKKCYWSNKDKCRNNNDELSVSVHIRRANLHDRGQAGSRVTTPNSYYLNVMNHIRKKYKDKKISFYIFSQGNIDSFRELENVDTKLYLNYDVVETFKMLVSSDILVTSPSCFSYVAGLITDGEVYYKNFWHPPKKDWIVMG
jgi:hypothetical protein